MKGKYVTVRCPRCNSVSQLKAAGVRTTTFMCPVCLEGEIEYQGKQMRTYRLGSESPKKSRVLVTI